RHIPPGAEKTTGGDGADGSVYEDGAFDRCDLKIGLPLYVMALCDHNNKHPRLCATASRYLFGQSLMSFTVSVLSSSILILSTLVSGLVIGRATMLFSWHRFAQDRPLQHRLLGATVFVMLLWQLRAQAVDWLTLHLMF